MLLHVMIHLFFNFVTGTESIVVFSYLSVLTVVICARASYLPLNLICLLEFQYAKGMGWHGLSGSPFLSTRSH